jgi:hypothetical protein
MSCVDCPVMGSRMCVHEPTETAAPKRFVEIPNSTRSLAPRPPKIIPIMKQAGPTQQRRAPGSTGSALYRARSSQNPVHLGRGQAAGHDSTASSDPDATSRALCNPLAVHAQVNESLPASSDRPSPCSLRSRYAAWKLFREPAHLAQMMASAT